MDEKTLTSIEACKMLGASAIVLEKDSKQCSYIPMVNLRKEELKCKALLQELNDCMKNLKISFDFDKHIESETFSMSPNISVNSSEKTKSYIDSQRKESRNGFQAVNGPFHNPDHQKVYIKEWSPDDYAKVEKEIYASIKYAHRKALIVWCPTLDVESELVHVWLKNSVAFMYDRWIRKDLHNATDAWGGVVAVYPDRIAAKNAAADIPEKHEYVFLYICILFVKINFHVGKIRYFGTQNFVFISINVFASILSLKYTECI